MNEFSPKIPERIEANIESFRRKIKQEMGDNEHAKHINFEELNDMDMTLYELYLDDILDEKRLKEASNEALMFEERSSGFFRGWLANQLGIRNMTKARAARDIQ